MGQAAAMFAEDKRAVAQAEVRWVEDRRPVDMRVASVNRQAAEDMRGEARNLSAVVPVHIPVAAHIPAVAAPDMDKYQAP